MPAINRVKLDPIRRFSAPAQREALACFEGLESRVLLSGAIAGTKFADLDGDGRRDAGEPGLSGWTIYLDLNQNQVFDAATEPFTTTDSNGNYGFSGLSPGLYQIGEV